MKINQVELIFDNFLVLANNVLRRWHRTSLDSNFPILIWLAKYSQNFVQELLFLYFFEELGCFYVLRRSRKIYVYLYGDSTLTYDAEFSLLYILPKLPVYAYSIDMYDAGCGDIIYTHLKNLTNIFLSDLIGHR